VNAGDNTRQRGRAGRRRLGYCGLVLGCFALVEAKAITAPASHQVTLGPAAGSPTTGTGGQPGAVPPSGTPTGSGGAGVRTVSGQPFDIGYGIVQVKVTLSGTRITDVIPVQLPSDGRSGSISSYALPKLRSEVIAAQSPNIDTVSGASYTSEGYARSVQSALDAARK
jgi:uncharacterized protein with FMN-binding domain